MSVIERALEAVERQQEALRRERERVVRQARSELAEMLDCTDEELIPLVNVEDPEKPVFLVEGLKIRMEPLDEEKAGFLLEVNGEPARLAESAEGEEHDLQDDEDEDEYCELSRFTSLLELGELLVRHRGNPVLRGPATPRRRNRR